MQRAMRMRTRLVSALRRHLDARGFQDIETPILTKATPEGARDYLVPSRVHAGEFYALPQSPQLFKQLLMIAGFDRYYQIARCFRDEDLRADRQPEFTQLDMEFAFVEERDVQDAVEEMIRAIFKRDRRRRAGRAVPAHDLRRGDAPLRFGQARSAHRAGTGRRRRAGEARRIQGVRRRGQRCRTAASPRCACRAAPNSRASRSTSSARMRRSTAPRALAWIRVDDRAKGREGINSPIAKFLDDATLTALLDRGRRAERRPDVLRRRRVQDRVSDFMGALRLKVGRDRGLVENAWKPLWVIDFPMFEYDARREALRRPASSVHRAEGRRRGRSASANARIAVSRGYDMVLNGNEIGGGSIRIHRPEMQSAVFDLLGIGADEAQAKFGFLLEALKFGAPPHGGIAFGIDRIAALMAGTESIRDVIAFPKTTSAQDLMTAAPSSVPEAQLDELHVRVVEPKKS